MPHTSPVFRTELVKQLSRLYRGMFGEQRPAASPPSSADSLLKYAGTWAGDDLEDCLRDVLHSRGEAHF